MCPFAISYLFITQRIIWDMTFWSYCTALVCMFYEKTLDRDRAGLSHGAVLLIITHIQYTHVLHHINHVCSWYCHGCKQLVSDLLTLLWHLCSYIYALPFHFMHGCISFDLSQIGFQISHWPSHECTLSHTAEQKLYDTYCISWLNADRCGPASAVEHC